MTDTPSGAGPCVRGWAKGVLVWDDIRTAHWMASPPSFPSSPSHTQQHQPTIFFINMSYESTTDFHDFITGLGREGPYSSNKENSGKDLLFG